MRDNSLGIGELLFRRYVTEFVAQIQQAKVLGGLGRTVPSAVLCTACCKDGIWTPGCASCFDSGRQQIPLSEFYYDLR